MRVSKPPGQRRAELVAAARQLFDEKGVEHTRVSDIVRKVGVAQGVFYYYFTSKEELVREVVRLVGDEVTAKAEGILQDEGSTFYQKLAAFIELYIALVDQFLADDETSLQPLHGAAEKSGSLAAQSAWRLTACLRRLIEQGAKEGRLEAGYPWESTQVLLHGLRRLAEDKLPSRRMLYTVVEEGLCLPAGSLVRLARGPDGPISAKIPLTPEG